MQETTLSFLTVDDKCCIVARTPVCTFERAWGGWENGWVDWNNRDAIRYFKDLSEMHHEAEMLAKATGMTIAKEPLFLTVPVFYEGEARIYIENASNVAAALQLARLKMTELLPGLFPPPLTPTCDAVSGPLQQWNAYTRPLSYPCQLSWNNARVREVVGEWRTETPKYLFGQFAPVAWSCAYKKKHQLD